MNIKGQKSHDTVANALKIVENLEHRAGKDAEGKTGDGVGILLQISHKFFTNVCRPLGIFLGSERDYGVGMFFFPQDELKRNQAKNIFEVIVEKEGLKFLGWREVPIRKEILGKKALECMPCIMQGFIERPKKVKQGLDFDRRLYVVRRVFEQSSDDTYVASLSSRTIVYKGMFLVKQLRMFFEDLQNPDYESAIAVVHSRFSTNTNPAGKEHIRTVSSYITEKSIPFVAMQIRCGPERKTWNPSIWKESFIKSFRQSIPQVPILPCWITRWNLW